MSLAVLGIVVLMPFMAPLLIPGVSVSSFALAKQLGLAVLLPLMAGAVINVYTGILFDPRDRALLAWFRIAAQGKNRAQHRDNITEYRRRGCILCGNRRH